MKCDVFIETFQKIQYNEDAVIDFSKLTQLIKNVCSNRYI